MPLQINKKFTNQETIDKLEANIGYLRGVINRRKEVSKGGSEGIKVALEILKDRRRDITSLQTACFFQTTHVKMLRSLEYAGEIAAIDFVIALFEDPESTVVVYKDQLTNLERSLSELRKYPLREE